MPQPLVAGVCGLLGSLHQSDPARQQIKGSDPDPSCASTHSATSDLWATLIGLSLPPPAVDVMEEIVELMEMSETGCGDAYHPDSAIWFDLEMNSPEKRAASRPGRTLRVPQAAHHAGPTPTTLCQIAEEEPSATEILDVGALLAQLAVT